MICPACKVGVRLDIKEYGPVYATDAANHKGYDVAHGFCPECNHLLVMLRRGTYYQAEQFDDETRELMDPIEVQVIYPGSAIRVLDDEIPKHYRDAYIEAAQTASVSSKASAALSRRLLQQIFWDELGIKRGSLAIEIDDFISKPGTPVSLADAVDAIRAIGNFAAHPLKDQRTTEIIDVEPGEAEWLLDVLESLFDFVFIQPLRLKARREIVNEKLKSAGKPILKRS